MKRDQYIPHEVSMRNTTEVMNLIENEGMAGYGIYWALLEYLRTQDDYVGDLRVLKSLARQLKTSIDRLLRILKSYELFEVTDYAFRSRKLEAVMKPLEDKRKAMVKQSYDDRATTVLRNPCNTLKTKDASALSKVKESKEENTPSISSSSAEAAEVKTIKYTPAWEQYVDSLQHEEQWKELMAMRTGLKKNFYKFFPRIVENFKQHVRLLGQPGVASFRFSTHNSRFNPIVESKTPDLPDEEPQWDNSNWLAKKQPDKNALTFEPKRLGVLPRTPRRFFKSPLRLVVPRSVTPWTTAVATIVPMAMLGVKKACPCFKV